MCLVSLAAFHQTLNLLLDPFKTHGCAEGTAEHNAVYGYSSNDNRNQGEKLILIAEPEEELCP